MADYGFWFVIGLLIGILAGSSLVWKILWPRYLRLNHRLEQTETELNGLIHWLIREGDHNAAY